MQNGICAECTCPKRVQKLLKSCETTKRSEPSPVHPHVGLRCRDAVPPEQLAVGEQRDCLDAELTSRCEGTAELEVLDLRSAGWERLRAQRNELDVTKTLMRLRARKAEVVADRGEQE